MGGYGGQLGGGLSGFAFLTLKGRGLRYSYWVLSYSRYKYDRWLGWHRVFNVCKGRHGG